MNDIITKIEKLKKDFAKHIATYHPIDEKKIGEMGAYLGVKIDEDLKELYKYSDGIGFVDYVVFSISNKKIERLDLANTRQSLEQTNKLEFMGTSCGKSFLISTDPC